MTNIINLTPHAVNVITSEGTIEFPSAGVARAAQASENVGSISGIPVCRVAYGAPEGLPEFHDGTYYIVSALTAQAAAVHGRTTADLLMTSDPVRDSEGRIIGCRALAVI